MMSWLQAALIYHADNLVAIDMWCVRVEVENMGCIYDFYLADGDVVFENGVQES